MDILEPIKQSTVEINRMFSHLNCVKCSLLPKERIYILYRCNHKYCEDCKEKLSLEEECGSCKSVRKSGELMHDILTSNLLSELRKFQDKISALTAKAIEENSVLPTKSIHGIETDDGINVENMEVDMADEDEVDNPQHVPALKQPDVNAVNFNKSNPESDCLNNAIAATQFRKSPPPLKPKKIFQRATTNSASKAKRFAIDTDSDSDFLKEIRNPEQSKRLPFKQLKTYTKSSKPKSKPRLNLHPDGDSDVDLFSTPSPTKAKKDKSKEDRPPDLTPYSNLEHPLESRRTIRMLSYETGSLLDIKAPSSLGNPASDCDLGGIEDVDGNGPFSPPPPLLTPYELKSKIKRGITEVKQEQSLNSNALKNVGYTKKLRAKRLVTPTAKSAIPLDTSLPVLPTSKKILPTRGGGAVTAFRTPGPIIGRRRRISAASSADSNASSTFSNPSPQVMKKRNAKGETLLHVASRKGEIEKVKELIAAGVELDACDYNGYTALHEAISSRSKSKNNFAISKLLCEAGCSVNIPAGDYKETPLHEASRASDDALVSLLLSHSASPNIRNSVGSLPRDVTGSESVKKVFDDAVNVIKGVVPPSQAMNDPAVLKLQFEKAVIFFAYNVEPELFNEYQNVLKFKNSSKLRGDVTHIVFHSDDENSHVPSATRVPFCLEYLYGIMNGAWMLSSKWIHDSHKAGTFINPKDYEILGCEPSTLPGTNIFHEGDGAPKRARENKELGHPGLFHGMNFLLYKRSIFDKLGKKDLVNLITTGSGCVINREPSPDAVDPLENPVRFHADLSSKLTLTSHVILFDERNEPTKKFNMEHVKSLSVNWLIESIGNFKLLDPDDYLSF